MRPRKADEMAIGPGREPGARPSGVSFETEHWGVRKLIAERLKWLDGPTHDPRDRRRCRLRGPRMVRPEDLRGRDMVAMYHLEGLSFSEIGRRMGVDHKTAAKRIRRLTGGLLRPEYGYCLIRRGPLSWDLQELARQRYVLGLSCAEIARRNRLSMKKVKHRLRYIEIFL